MTEAGCWVGVDLGATWVRVVLSDAKGHFIGRVRENVDVTSSESGQFSAVRDYSDFSQEIEQQAEVVRIATKYIAQDGFRLNVSGNHVGELQKLLRYIEEQPQEIMNHVNHEVF